MARRFTNLCLAIICAFTLSGGAAYALKRMHGQPNLTALTTANCQVSRSRSIWMPQIFMMRQVTLNCC